MSIRFVFHGREFRFRWVSKRGRESLIVRHLPPTYRPPWSQIVPSCDLGRPSSDDPSQTGCSNQHSPRATSPMSNHRGIIADYSKKIPSLDQKKYRQPAPQTFHPSANQSSCASTVCPAVDLRVEDTAARDRLRSSLVSPAYMPGGAVKRRSEVFLKIGVVRFARILWHTCDRLWAFGSIASTVRDSRDPGDDARGVRGFA